MGSMSTRRIKVIAAACLLLGFLAGIGVSKITMNEKPKDNPADIPRRAVIITINQSQREELFTQTRKFADKWGYATYIAPIDPSGSHFYVDLWRSDIKVLGAYLADSGELHFGFFYTESTRPVPDSYFDEEINDLRNFISEIPNTKFSIEK